MRCAETEHVNGEHFLYDYVGFPIIIITLYTE